MVMSMTQALFEEGTSMEPIPGYRLLERLGKGGFGEVWKAEAPGGLHKAVKLVYGNLLHGLSAEFSNVEWELDALTRMKGLRHPFILSIDRFDVIKGQLIIVTELADNNLWGRFLECRDKGWPGIPRDELLSYLGETAEALDFMTLEFDLQHLDVKPQNLFLFRNHIKLGDFSLVRDLRAENRSVPRSITPVYSAPEVFNGSISLASDQYSLAIVYAELLTGQRPFDGTHMRQLMLQHQCERPRLDRLPESDRLVVERALAKKPEDRFPCCLALIEALHKARPSLGRSHRFDRPDAATADNDLQAWTSLNQETLEEVRAPITRTPIDSSIPDPLSSGAKPASFSSTSPRSGPGETECDESLDLEPYRQWVKDLRHADSQRRVAALQGLARLGPLAKAVLGALVDRMHDVEASVRRLAILVVQKIGLVGQGGAAVVAGIGERLQDRDQNVSWQALLALQQLGSAAVVVLPALHEALNDSRPLIRIKAAEILWCLDPQQVSRALPVLVREVERGSSESCLAIESLCRIGPDAREALPALVKAVRGRLSGRARQLAITALGEIGSAARSAVPLLIETLTDRDPQVGRTAAETLFRLDPETAFRLGIRRANLLKTLRATQSVLAVSASTSEQLAFLNGMLIPELLRMVTEGPGESHNHLLRIRRFARCLGEEAARLPAFAGQIDPVFIQMLECFAPLHDIGRVALPDHLLRKPDKLSPDERQLMQAHTTIGAELLREVARLRGAPPALLQMAIDIARHHHESYDGKGYPDRLNSEAIPLSARLVSICDVYDALRTPRAYRPAFPHAMALQVMTQSSASQFDPLLLQAFVGCAEKLERLFNESPDRSEVVDGG
jgi:HD-GYP domain-containing protein (c-di-GMP phosphodiesterase class II)/serine/threonine protein kinase